MKNLILISSLMVLTASASAEVVYRGACARAAAQTVEKTLGGSFYLRIDSSVVSEDPSVYRVEGILGDRESGMSAYLNTRVILDPVTCANARGAPFDGSALAPVRPESYGDFQAIKTQRGPLADHGGSHAG